MRHDQVDLGQERAVVDLVQQLDVRGCGADGAGWDWAEGHLTDDIQAPQGLDDATQEGFLLLVGGAEADQGRF